MALPTRAGFLFPALGAHSTHIRTHTYLLLLIPKHITPHTAVAVVVAEAVVIIAMVVLVVVAMVADVLVINNSRGANLNRAYFVFFDVGTTRSASYGGSWGDIKGL